LKSTGGLSLPEWSARNLSILYVRSYIAYTSLKQYIISELIHV